MKYKTYYETYLQSVSDVNRAFRIFMSKNPNAVIVSVSHTFEADDNTYSIFIIYKEI